MLYFIFIEFNKRIKSNGKIKRKLFTYLDINTAHWYNKSQYLVCMWTCSPLFVRCVKRLTGFSIKSNFHFCQTEIYCITHIKPKFRMLSLHNGRLQQSALISIIPEKLVFELVQTFSFLSLSLSQTQYLRHRNTHNVQCSHIY